MRRRGVFEKGVQQQLHPEVVDRTPEKDRRHVARPHQRGIKRLARRVKHREMLDQRVVSLL
jgi:hypothetical protein